MILAISFVERYNFVNTVTIIINRLSVSMFVFLRFFVESKKRNFAFDFVRFSILESSSVVFFSTFFDVVFFSTFFDVVFFSISSTLFDVEFVFSVWRSTLWINLIDDESSTIYKLKRKRRKEKKNEKCKEYLRLRMQKTRNALNVLLEMLCSSQSKQSSFREIFITFRCDAKLRWRELSMTRTLDNVDESRVFFWSKNEWNIRHIIFFFRLSNFLICFQSIRFRFVKISIIKFFHYIECISKFLRIISDFIFIVFFSFNKKWNSTIIFANVENIIYFSFFFVIYNYRRREFVDLFK